MAPEPKDAEGKGTCGENEPAEAAPTSESNLILGAQSDAKQRPGNDPEKRAGGGGSKEQPEGQSRRTGGITDEAAHDGNEPSQEDTPDAEAPESLLGGENCRRGWPDSVKPTTDAPRRPYHWAGHPQQGDTTTEPIRQAGGHQFPEEGDADDGDNIESLHMREVAGKEEHRLVGDREASAFNKEPEEDEGVHRT